MVIYESKVFKIEISDNGILKVDEGGRKLNIDLKIFVEKNIPLENQLER